MLLKMRQARITSRVAFASKFLVCLERSEGENKPPIALLRARARACVYFFFAYKGDRSRVVRVIREIPFCRQTA